MWWTSSEFDFDLLATFCLHTELVCLLLWFVSQLRDTQLIANCAMREPSQQWLIVQWTPCVNSVLCQTQLYRKEGVFFHREPISKPSSIVKSPFDFVSKNSDSFLFLFTPGWKGKKKRTSALQVIVIQAFGLQTSEMCPAKEHVWTGKCPQRAILLGCAGSHVQKGSPDLEHKEVDTMSLQRTLKPNPSWPGSHCSLWNTTVQTPGIYPVALGYSWEVLHCIHTIPITFCILNI